MAAQADVFDGMDDLTAQMCIDLQLEDLAAVTGAFVPSATSPSDAEVALELHRTELKAYRAERGLPEPPPAAVVRFKCEACGDRFTDEESVQTPCLHHYCNECLEELFLLSMRDRTLYPPRCCRQPIPWEEVRDVVSEEFKVSFEEKREELDDPSPMYCHDKRCSKYVKPDARDTTSATCSNCHRMTCTLCKQEIHWSACPEDEEVKKMREYAKKEGNQECTRCHQLVELALGCNHITCLCKHEFCYGCGIEWKHCECRVWDEDRLLARADNVANRPGMGGAAAAPAIAEQLRRDHQDCDDHGHQRMVSERGSHLCEGCQQVQPLFYYRCRACHTVLCRRCRRNRA
ncbi:uncharacterized protein RCC_10269 [Ramularia collo-cygni]|uniref:RBR-type E3 ubiquitin transferase n=1 Tax=Ramularia collo-cygni TaxID=112498 RepID=A0A2D3VNN9_9PEZI|nr:uncharacterized protein RCC_10269 [Ramularia collo-cygni]CZT24544.1 uncharacterized protein RCC_10269 [Ramularia collo-cygni]